MCISQIIPKFRSRQNYYLGLRQTHTQVSVSYNFYISTGSLFENVRNNQLDAAEQSNITLKTHFALHVTPTMVTCISFARLHMKFPNSVYKNRRKNKKHGCVSLPSGLLWLPRSLQLYKGVIQVNDGLRFTSFDGVFHRGEQKKSAVARAREKGCWLISTPRLARKSYAE